MSAPPQTSGDPITERRQLVEWFEQGCKPRNRWRIGTEHEKHSYRLSDLKPLPYEGADGIRALLEGMTRFGWAPVLEGGNPIALTRGTCAITLEPGGQLELSGAPLESLHETCQEVGQHLKEVREIGQELGVGMLGLGFNPKWARAEIPWMPKGRYRVMRAYMPKKGGLGLDMMLRTCTVQVNLDFESEADMARKFRVAMALQPLATAIFANSPFLEGKPSGFLSLRAHIWTDTDPDRCGILPFAFESGFGFERYVDYMLDVPMYFVYRDGKYLDAAGQSFRDFLAGKLPALPGAIPGIGDWSDHITTAFPEVRLKRFIEMRGADSGPWQRICALPALWVGLLYDPAALEAAYALCRDWSFAEVRQLQRDVTKQALQAKFRGKPLLGFARDVLQIARTGLKARNRRSSTQSDETVYLEPLDRIIESGRTAAEEMLQSYERRWGRSVDPAYAEYSY
jgi:glutamate--cysteine ligase